MRTVHLYTVDIFLCSFFFFFLDRIFGFYRHSQQGLSKYGGAFYEMTDASAPELVLQSLSSSLDKLYEDLDLKSSFLHVRRLRALRQVHDSLDDISVKSAGRTDCCRFEG